MSILEIIQFPHPVLRNRAAEVEKIDDRIRELAANMVKTMYHAEGIGLAAPQVGVGERLIVVDLSCGERAGELVTIINPVLTKKEGEIALEEGCLSVPDLREKVTRADLIVVQGFDLEGKAVEIEGRELFAVAIQHEIDHLEGVLFFDHISRLKRSRYMAKRKKALECGDKG
jgi:peptide deformylase